MQKLALMMAVMILGMSPAHGCSIGADSRSLGVGGPAEMMPLLPTWFSGDGKTLMARDIDNSAAAEGNRPVVPGRHLIGQILPQIQLKVEGLERIGDEIMRMGQGRVKDGPDPRGKDRVYSLQSTG